MSGTSAPVLVVGATGKQGGSVIRALQRLPNPPKLRALSRNPSSPAAVKLTQQGVEVVKGSLCDPPSLRAALQGCASAFLFTAHPGKNDPTEDAQGKAFVDAAKETSLPFLVFTSVSDATPTCGVPHFETKAKIEEAIVASGIPHTILALTAFYENLPRQSGFVTFMALGLFDAALQGRKLQMIAVDDIGYFAAQALSNPSAYAGRHIQLAGDELSMEQVRQTYSQVQRTSVWKSRMPAFVINLLPHDFSVMMKKFGKEGYTARIGELRGEYGGLKTFKMWLEEGRK
ncbi:hypothetical protein JCM11641_003542 [Rhodosporidiobolus odoratus]